MTDAPRPIWLTRDEAWGAGLELQYDAAPADAEQAAREAVQSWTGNEFPMFEDNTITQRVLAAISGSDWPQPKPPPYPADDEGTVLPPGWKRDDPPPAVVSRQALDAATAARDSYRQRWLDAEEGLGGAVKALQARVEALEARLDRNAGLPTGVERVAEGYVHDHRGHFGRVVLEADLGRDCVDIGLHHNWRTAGSGWRCACCPATSETQPPVTFGAR
jgi:hypothetical protein